MKTPIKPKPKAKSFSRRTAAQKRVAIARDVLLQIKHRRLIAHSGHYWQVSQTGGFGIGRKALRARATRCQACGAGAAVLSGIRLFNRETIGRYNGGAADECQLKGRWFTPHQLALIECAFEENGRAMMESTLNWEDKARAKRFNSKRKKPASRLVAIYRNIIANKGEFKP